jgi:hypothetical protein
MECSVYVGLHKGRYARPIVKEQERENHSWASMAYLALQPDFSGDCVAGLYGRPASRPRNPAAHTSECSSTSPSRRITHTLRNLRNASDGKSMSSRRDGP